MSYRQRKGLSAERAAAQYLEEQGYEILERRYRFGHKEIDLIAGKEGLVVFVEVKSRSNELFGPAELSVHERKRRNLVEAAGGYLLERGIPGPEINYRFDVILFHPPEKGGETKIEHIPDAFRA